MNGNLIQTPLKKDFLITTLMTMKISHFSFSRRIIPLKHLQNISSVLEKFHFIGYIRMCGPSQLSVIRSNLKRGKKKAPQNPTLLPNPQAVQDECKVVFGITQWECNGEESGLVMLVTAEGGDPGGLGVCRCGSVLQTQLFCSQT